MPSFPGNGIVTPTLWSLPVPEVGSKGWLCPVTSALKLGSGNAPGDEDLRARLLDLLLRGDKPGVVGQGPPDRLVPRET